MTHNKKKRMKKTILAALMAAMTLTTTAQTPATDAVAAAQRAAQTPTPEFIDMTIADTEGRQHKLSEWVGHGQYVMLDFWASWCGPCRREMPNVVANYAKYHERGFEIVGISFDQRAAAWKEAIGQLGMAWPQLSDLGGWQSGAVEVYGVHSIPASILFDGEGKVVATNLRGEQLGEQLKHIYGF